MQKANKNEVRKEIADLINRIKEQSDRIGMQREIPQSELDLILHRIEELHRKTVVWSFLNELPVETVKQEPTPVEPPPILTKQEPPAIPVPSPEPVVIKQEVPVPQEMPVKGPTIIPETRKAEPETAAKPQLKDIKTFIGFNEKIMYIRQVFKGDDAAYTAAIEQFNAMNSWDEAQAFLSVLANEYKWGAHNEPVEIFTQTVKRRFS